MAELSTDKVMRKYSIDTDTTKAEPLAYQGDVGDPNCCQEKGDQDGDGHDGQNLADLKEQLQALEVSVAPSNPRSSPLCTLMTPTVLAPSAPSIPLLGETSLPLDSHDTSPPFSPSPSVHSLSAFLEEPGDQPDLFATTSDHDSSDISQSSSEAAIEASDNMPLTPRVAKELSVATGTFYKITTFDDGDLVPEDEPKDEGWVLHGYLCGKPVYLNTTGMYAELKAIETQTVLGRRYITQSIDTCFRHELAAGSLDKSDVEAEKSSDMDSRAQELALPVSSTTNSFSADSGIGMETDDDLIEPKKPLPTERREPSPSPHRTYSNEWIKIAASPLGGYGIFAKVYIPKFTHILLEQPFMSLKNLGRLHDKYAKLTEQEKAVFDNFHPYDKNTDDPIQQRWSANSFWAKQREVVLAIGSNFNHACHSKRTAQYCWDDARKVMVFTAMSDIRQGDEIFISYGEYAHVLVEKFGFVCQCGGCVGAGSWHIPSLLHGTAF